MAKITDLAPNSEGTTREAELITAKKRKIRRPINLLIPLELSCEEDTSAERNTSSAEGPVQKHPYNLRPRRNKPLLPFSTNVAVLISIIFTLFAPAVHSTQKNAPIKIQCDKRGMTLQTNQSLDLEICIEDECKSFNTSSSQLPLQFPPYLTIYDHDVYLKWKTNTTTASLRITCPGIDFCENIQCWFCFRLLFNPECWPTGALILFTIIIYPLATLDLFIFHFISSIITPCKLTFRILGTLVIALTRSLFSRRGSLRSRRLAQAIAIFSLFVKSQTCQDVNVLSFKTNVCDSSLGKEFCKVQISEIIKINNFRQEACLRLYNNETLISHLRIAWKRIWLYCDQSSITSTREALL